jgi:hypothetical protein
MKNLISKLKCIVLKQLTSRWKRQLSKFWWFFFSGFLFLQASQTPPKIQKYPAHILDIEVCFWVFKIRTLHNRHDSIFFPFSLLHFSKKIPKTLKTLQSETHCTTCPFEEIYVSTLCWITCGPCIVWYLLERVLRKFFCANYS